MLVTGASGGIGEAIAVEFARGGAVVVISSRIEQQLQSLAQRLNSADGQALALRCDVADTEQVAALGTMIAERVGTVQILINSAGVAPAASFLEMSASVWDDVIRVNLTGTYNCCKTFLPGIPIVIQKIAMNIVGPIGRLFGYRAIYKKYSGIEK